jgi:protein involved in polysaccharide export with SLBB domain
LEEGKRPRVSDALATAGGLKIKPEQSRISVARTGPNGRLIAFKVDPVGLLELSDVSQNMSLQDGDIVSVAAVKRTMVVINGEVKTAGAYDLAEGDGVVELISRAGGTTPDAATSQVKISHRDGTSTVVNTTAALTAGGNRITIPLRDGDQVVVPRSENRILITGAVARPGTYAIPENRPLTIGDALALAGGTQSFAKTVSVMRPNGTSATKQDFRLDRPVNGLIATTQPIQSGDVLWVPEGRQKQSTLQSILSFLPAARIFGF